ncbi:MAG TPA: TonB-dependent receptor [Bacteroidales bacterium]
MRRTILLIIFFFFFFNLAESQENRLQERISFKAVNVPLEQVIQELTQKYSLNFFYSPTAIPLKKPITIDVESKPITELITVICAQASLRFTAEHGKIILYPDEQQKLRDFVTISGFVSDSLTGERLLGAVVSFPDINKGTSTNAYGYYVYSVPKGTYKLRCSYIGYGIFQKTVELVSNRQENIRLNIAAVPINEVKLAVKANNKLSSVHLGQDNVPLSLLKKAPSLLGEKDVMQYLKLMPGIISANEVSDGLYIRGSTPQQSSFRLDDAPIFNLYHISGWFSAVNPDALKDINVYKSHLPGKEGNSLSSVVDLRLRDGNNRNYAITGGIGTIMSRLTFEGPIISDKASFIISGRRSYLDQLLKLFRKSGDVQNSDFYFYDLNMKVNYNPNQNNTFYLSAFATRDFLAENGSTAWENKLLSYRWNHLFSSKLFFNLTGTASIYNHEFQGVDNDNFNYKFTTRIRDYNGKLDFTYYLKSNKKINFGTYLNYQDLLPILYQTNNPQQEYTLTSINIERRLISTVYVESETELTKALGVSGGFRFAVLQNVGKNHFSPYWGPQPSVILRYKLSPASSVKAAYSRNYQFNQGANVFNFLIPFDRYLFVDDKIKPQYADHFSAGYFHQFNEDEFELSLEPYYSHLYQQYRFNYSGELFLGTDYQSQAIKGQTRAYGIEFSLRKLTGRLNGILNYTLSKVETKEEGVNQNRYYCPYFDRRHNLLVSLMFEASKKVSLSASWVFMSGSPYNYPIAKYSIRGVTVPLFNDNNIDNNRMPDYHRLDVGLTLRFKQHKHYKHSLSFSVYNVYGHQNPFLYSYRDVINGNLNNEDYGQPNVQRKFSMVSWYFFQFVPAFSYEFSFF